MNCTKCENKIGTENSPPQYKQAFQVRVGHIEDDEITFLPHEDIGYYCSECLKKGV